LRQSTDNRFPRTGTLLKPWKPSPIQRRERVLNAIEDFCEKNDLEFEVIDLGTISFLRRLKLKMKGLKTPAISYGEKIVYGVPSEEDLKELLKS